MMKPITQRSNTSSEAEYIQALINQPWARDGRHCWRLVCDIQRDLFGIVLPVVMDVAPTGLEGRRMKPRLFADNPERARWVETEPVHGAVALMRRRAANPDDITHAGVFMDLNGGTIIHCDNPHGVVIDSIIDLESRGWRAIYLVRKA